MLVEEHCAQVPQRGCSRGPPCRAPAHAGQPCILPSRPCCCLASPFSRSCVTFLSCFSPLAFMAVFCLVRLCCPWVVCLDPLCAVSSHLKQPGGSSQSFPLPCLRSATIQSRCFRKSPLPVLSSSRFHTPRSRHSCHRLHPSACCSPCMALVSHPWCLWPLSGSSQGCLM